MAVQIIERPVPDSISEVGNCIRWVLNMTGIVSGNITKRLGYQLKTAAGDPITQPESFSPKEGVDFNLDFEEDILPFVYTNVPPYGLFSTFAESRDEPEMLIDVVLHYWEISHDADTCETTQGSESTDGPHTVVNGASNWFSPIRSFTPVLLTYKPKHMYVSRRTQDFVYFLARAGKPFNLRATIYGRDKVTVAGDLGPVPVPANASSVGVGPGNIYSILGQYADGAPSPIGMIKVWTDDDFEVYYHFDCSDTSYDLYFQSLEGGYSVMTMDRQVMSIKSNYKEVARYQPSCTKYGQAEMQTKGVSIANKESYQNITFVKELDLDDPADIFYYESFLASGSYYVALPSVYHDQSIGERNIVKFMPNSGNIRYHKDEDITLLTITGKIPRKYNLPNYAI